MEVRTLWNILIKILGLWLALEGIFIIPQLISAYSFFTDEDYGSITTYIVITVISITLYVGLVRLLLFQTYSVIDKLKLASSITEQRVNLNFETQNVISISIIIIGGIAFIDSVPQLVGTSIEFFKQNKLLKDYPQIGWIIFYALKSLIAYLMITNNKAITNFILSKSE